MAGEKKKEKAAAVTASQTDGSERVNDLLHVWPGLRMLLPALHDEVAEVGGHARRQQRPLALPSDALCQFLLRNVAAAEGNRARHDFVQQTAKRKNVRLLVVRQIEQHPAQTHSDRARECKGKNKMRRRQQAERGEHDGSGLELFARLSD